MQQIDKQTIEAVAEAYHKAYENAYLLQFKSKSEAKLIASEAAIKTLIDMEWRPAGEKDENGLLPCPWCGGKPDIREGNLHGYYIRCHSLPCHYEHTIMPSKEEAIKTWNTRGETK